MKGEDWEGASAEKEQSLRCCGFYPVVGMCSEVGSNPVRVSSAHHSLHSGLPAYCCPHIQALPVDADTATATNVAPYPLFEERGVSFQERKAREQTFSTVTFNALLLSLFFISGLNIILFAHFSSFFTMNIVLLWKCFFPPYSQGILFVSNCLMAFISFCSCL